MAVIPGRVSARATASSPSTASPCISTMSFEVWSSAPTFDSRLRKRSRKTGS